MADRKIVCLFNRIRFIKNRINSIAHNFAIVKRNSVFTVDIEGENPVVVFLLIFNIIELIAQFTNF